MLCLQQYQATSTKEPLKLHPFPDLPWSTVATDIFDWNGQHYLVLVNSYSGWFEIDQLRDMASTTVIRKLKRHFSVHGSPYLLFRQRDPVIRWSGLQGKSGTPSGTSTTTISDSQWWPDSGRPGSDWAVNRQWSSVSSRTSVNHQWRWCSSAACATCLPMICMSHAGRICKPNWKYQQYLLHGQ